MNILDRTRLDAPRISMDASAIEVTTEAGPLGFQKQLREMIRGARRRLSLAALYFGTDEKEQQLVDDVRFALEQSPELQVRFVFDYSRGRRRTRNGNTISFLHDLLRDFGERVELYMHKMPQFDGPAAWLPSPLDEAVAVFHFKALVSDETAVLTGANLSDEYFHCRQARYIVVRDRAFTDMLHGLVDTTTAHSMRADVDGNLHRPSKGTGDLVQSVLRHFEQAVESQDGEHDTVLMPVFQHPGLGLHQENELLRQLFSWTDGELVITTPYTNFPQCYVDALIGRLDAGCPHRTLLVTPSGNSHSFTTGRGLKALVPGVYLHNEQKLVRQMRAASENGHFQLRHYDREGWVFHSKGLWFSTAEETATVIGSSSFGGRSVARDFDMSCFIVTKNPTLRASIEGEVEVMLAHAPGERPVERVASWTAPLLVPLVKSYM